MHRQPPHADGNTDPPQAAFGAAQQPPAALCQEATVLRRTAKHQVASGQVPTVMVLTSDSEQTLSTFLVQTSTKENP
jgi:hypothetical protein